MVKQLIQFTKSHEKDNTFLSEGNCNVKNYVQILDMKMPSTQLLIILFARTKVAFQEKEII